MLTVPNEKGFFGQFGGTYVPETSMHAVLELQETYEKIKNDEQFQAELQDLLKNYVGRETPLYEAKQLAKEIGGARIFLKREDLNHTGAHKINNALGQALLAKYMGKTSIVAETGAGQHGVATATACALLGLQCTIFMGEVDIQRQQLNVFRMKLLGAKVESVTSGSKTLKDAVNEALRYWVTHIDDTHYLIGSALGPHPYPMIVRDFQRVIGRETRQQINELCERDPDAVVACVGGGSNAIGMFYDFVQTDVKLYGFEGGGSGTNTKHHAATMEKGKMGILHGSKMYLLQSEDGQVQEAHSISAGLDYPGIGPEHCYLRDTNRVTYDSVTDDEALEALTLLTRREGILPALESAHAVAGAIKLAKNMNPSEIIVVCLSGRGDKDVLTLMERMEGGNE